MTTSLLIDNWTLQDIGDCLNNGLSSDIASEILLVPSEKKHKIIDIPKSGLQIKMLLEFLVQLVLRDSLLVDDRFMMTWQEYLEHFEEITDSNLVRGFPFLEEEDKFREAREFIAQQLCATESLKEIHKRNQDSWAENNKVVDNYMSAVLWGGAGMLARSHTFQTPYSGHPLRQRVIEQTLMAEPCRDIISEITDWIETERMRLYEYNFGDIFKRQAHLTLPPIGIEVIEESNSVEDLIPVAVSFRDKYKQLREWLREVQLAVDEENSKKFAKYKRTLDLVSKDINREVSGYSWGATSLNIGFGLPSISISVPIIDNISKRFGIRSVLNKQVFYKSGEKSIEKILKMFGQNTPKYSMQVRDYLFKN